MADDFAHFQVKLLELQKELTGPDAKRRLKVVGELSRRDINQAVRGDLGDLSMSGWRRGSPIQIEGDFKVLSATQLQMQPTRKSAGPMRVLQQGRNQGNASGFSGPGVNRKTGLTGRNKAGDLRKVRKFKARRWNGRTEGKDTWTDAVDEMAKKVPKRIHDEWVQNALSKTFGR